MICLGTKTWFHFVLHHLFGFQSPEIMPFLVSVCLSGKSRKHFSKYNRWTELESEEMLKLTYRFIVDGHNISWKRVASKLAKRGIYHVGTECKHRFQYLRSTYIDAMNKNGGVHPAENQPYTQVLRAVAEAYMINK
jgi:Myb/SANT-like DNA-binding domain